MKELDIKKATIEELAIAGIAAGLQGNMTAFMKIDAELRLRGAFDGKPAAPSNKPQPDDEFFTVESKLATKALLKRVTA